MTPDSSDQSGHIHSKHIFSIDDGESMRIYLKAMLESGRRV